MKLTAQAVYDELTGRGIAVDKVAMEGGTFFAFRYNGKLRYLSGVSADLSTSTSRTICNNKDITALVAQLLGIRMPITALLSSKEHAEKFLRDHKQVVVKPTDGAHGSGITTNVQTNESLSLAIKRAVAVSQSKVLLQQQVRGADYRVLVIDDEVIAVSERTAARVTGDGRHTVRELIQIENEHNIHRAANYQKRLNYIDHEAADLFLGTSASSIPESGEVVTVVGTANIGTGGEATNRTGEVPAGMLEDALSLVRSVGAFICGVDFMYDKQQRTWYLIELNSSPSFGLHLSPSAGDSIDVTRIYVDKLLRRYDAIA